MDHDLSRHTIQHCWNKSGILPQVNDLPTEAAPEPIMHELEAEIGSLVAQLQSSCSIALPMHNLSPTEWIAIDDYESTGEEPTDEEIVAMAREIETEQDEQA